MSFDLDALVKTFGTMAPDMENDQDYFSASVLLPIVKTDEGLSLLFEVRAQSLGWQPGEICFPGGRIESGESPLEAAIRETSEELHIAVRDIQVLGPLNYVVAPIGVILYPFLGVISEHSVIRPSSSEVAEVFTVPLDYLMANDPVIGHLEVATQPRGDFPFHLLAHYQRDWKRRTVYPVYFYPYKQYVIWGLTARVLHSFITICKGIR